MSAKKVVLFRGPVLTQSGYGVHARQIVRWLLTRPNVDLYVQALPWGGTPWIVDASAYDGLIGQIFERTGPTPRRPDVTFQLQLPNEWDPSLGDINVGITAGIEADVSNDKWKHACNTMTHVVVPSQHAKSSLYNEIVKVPVTVIPEAAADAMFEAPNGTLSDFSTKFNFLLFGQLTGATPETDRKNTFNSVKWLCETFAGDKDVGIVIKTNAGRNTKIDRLYVKNTLNVLLSQVRKGMFPRVHLVHGDMSDRDVNALYRHKQVRALVSLTRGEGFGLPTLEASVTGLPVVATGWSGHLDFLRRGKFTEIAYKLAPVAKTRIDGEMFINGAQWAEPDEADFKKRIMKFKDSPYVPRDWAKDLSQTLSKTHSFSAIVAQYDAVFGDIV